MGKKWFGALALAVVMLGSCKGMKESYDKSFLESWHKSFIDSCVGKDEAKREMCTCVADKAIVEMTVSQLSIPSESIKVIQEKIIPECQAK